jgi:hypothetical protein
MLFLVLVSSYPSNKRECDRLEELLRELLLLELRRDDRDFRRDFGGCRCRTCFELEDADTIMDIIRDKSS